MVLQDVQALEDVDTGVDHGGELPAENDQRVQLDLADAVDLERGQAPRLLLGDLDHLHVPFAELGQHRLLVLAVHLPADGLPPGFHRLVCKGRH